MAQAAKPRPRARTKLRTKAPARSRAKAPTAAPAPEPVAAPEPPVAPKADEGSPGPGMITVAQAAKLLMIGDERVRQLVKAGYIPKPAKNAVPLVGAVQGYIRFLKDEDRRSSKSAADSRVRDARAAEIELRIAERQRTLIPVEDATAALDAVVAATRAEFVGLPARVTRDLTFRRKIETEVDGSLERIAERLDAAANALASGGELLPTDPEDGA